MIKELIRDLTYDNITLNQGLTRAKLIAYKIDNSELKNWIGNELNGYSSNKDLPSYRIIPCQSFGVVHNPYYGKQQITLDFTNLDKSFNKKINTYEVLQGVDNLEKQSARNTTGSVNLSIEFVKLCQRIFESEDLIDIKRQIHFGQLGEIVGLVKQKLLDTLLDLDKEFPAFETNYLANMENKEKSSSIINNHIYGDNTQTNVAIGDSNSQTINSDFSTKVENLLEELKNLGVQDEELKEIKEIVSDKTDKKTIGKKALEWVGKVATKAVEKGVELQIPLLITKIQNFI